MKLNPQEIRAAMDSRLSFMHESDARRARIRQTVQGQGKPRRSRKMNIGFALTAFAVVVMAGFALATGLNLFGHSGNEDLRNSDVTSQPLPTQQWTFTSTSGKNEARAYITSTDYDSDSLVIAYAIENAMWQEPFTPTEEQLSKMIRSEGASLTFLEGYPLVREYLDAVESGTPFGITLYSMIADDRTDAGFGIDLGKADSTTGETIDGTVFAVREYTAPLPDRDYLNLHILLWKNAVYLYFDGTDVYMMNAPLEAMGAMTATARRADETAAGSIDFTAAYMRHMTGEGALESGVAVYAKAYVSEVFGEITLTALGEGFADPNLAYAQLIEGLNEDDGVVKELIGDFWYELAVWDENDTYLPTGNTYQTNAHTITANFESNGSLPETLSVMLLIRSRAAGTNVIRPITLTPAEKNAAAAITFADYSDEGIVVRYSNQNETWWDVFMPSQAQLESMTKTETAIPAMLEANTENPLVRQYIDAVQNGIAFGLARYTLVADERVTMNGGAELGTPEQSYEEIADGIVQTVREYRSPQAIGDYLILEIPLWTTIEYLYFDGTDSYATTAPPVSSGMMTTTVFHTDDVPAFDAVDYENTAYVRNWEELNAAALAGKTNVIVMANITYGEDDSTVVFTNPVTLQAVGTQFTIDGGGKQILCVQGAEQDSPLTEETVIRNLFFLNGRNGDGSSDVYQAGYGGAVFVQGPLRMENCSFMSSSSAFGALCVSDGDAVLMDCWLADNAASGLCMLNGNATVTGCKFMENHAQAGGGIYGENANITVINSRFLRCVGEEAGGGIYLSGGDLTLTGCTLEENITEGSGGAVYLETGTLTLGEKTVMIDNTPDDIVQP